MAIDLGTLGGARSSAQAINDRGQIVGTSDVPDGASHAFRWSATDGMHDIGIGSTYDISNRGQIVGAPSFSWTPQNGRVDLPLVGAALRVNEAGQVAGNAAVRVCQPVFPFVCLDRTQAFSWTVEGGPLILGGFDTFDYSFFQGLNERGQVVGYSAPESLTQSRAFVWSASDGLRDPVGRPSVATAINDRGQIVGSLAILAFPACGPGCGWFFHAMSTQPDGGVIDLGTLPGRFDSDAIAVNNQGQIAGNSENPQSVHAFVLTPGRGMLDAGTPGGCCSTAAVMSDGGLVVGIGTTPDDAEHGFAWTQNTELMDLGTLGGSRSAAVAVNARGQVVGLSDLPDGRQHAALWQPIDPDLIARNLQTLVSGANFGQGAALLQNVLDSLNRGNATAACNQTNAFVNQVRAQAAKGIGADQADIWMFAAGDLRAALHCR
jgi:probable HAF family extracellular repeat protein